jgi:hypothetical protein
VYFGFLLLVCLISAGCSKSSGSLSPEVLSECLQLKIIAPQPPSGADAILLEELEPVTLRAELKNSIAERFSLRKKDENIKWSCTAGGISSPRNEIKTVWTPPARSYTATVRLSYSAWYNKFPRGIFRADIEVGTQASIVFITPTRGSRLRNGFLDGFEIGEYLDPTDKSTIRKYAPQARWFEKYPERYAPPKFFYKVTEQNRDLRISEHFTLGNFAFDYPWFSLGLPQYIALDYALVEKLEDLLGAVQQDGLAKKGFKFVYAYRPPRYNLTSIIRDGEDSLKAPFSMHQYGRAADIIIDDDDDLVLDDLNGDGEIDIHDAGVIMHYVNILDRRYREEESLSRRDPYGKVGGAGLYSRNDFPQRVQTPYIHIDVRGFLDDNGHLIRWPSRYPDGTPIRFADL